MQLDRKFIFAGGASTRYHTFDVHNRQDIGNHSFGVAWFCELITDGKATKNLIMAALAHDLAEHIVGDIPAPAKRANAILKDVFDSVEYDHLKAGGVSNYDASLYGFEKTVLKLSDCFEGLMFCIRERKLGNRNVEVAFGNFTSYIQKLLTGRDFDVEEDVAMERAEQLLKDIVKEWEDVLDE